MQCTEWPETRAEVFQGWLQEILTPQQIDDFNLDILINTDACKDFIQRGRSMRWKKSWNAAGSMEW